MSEPITETSDDQRPERAVAIRRFDAEITPGDGRTVSLRIVPFGQRATAMDGLGGVPKGVPYEEEIMPGAFDKQLTAAHRVLLNFEHQEGLQGVIGHGLALRQDGDGYHGDFRIHDGPDGDKALTLVREGVLTGASFEAVFLKSVRNAAGVVQRVKAHLSAVALCRTPSYVGAVVTGLREAEIEDETVIDPEFLPIPFDPEMAARLSALGIALPESVKAHLAETDTSAMSDTSEDDTRHPNDGLSSSEGDMRDERDRTD